MRAHTHTHTGPIARWKWMWNRFEKLTRTRRHEPVRCMWAHIRMDGQTHGRYTRTPVWMLDSILIFYFFCCCCWCFLSFRLEFVVSMCLYVARAPAHKPPFYFASLHRQPIRETHQNISNARVSNTHGRISITIDRTARVRTSQFSQTQCREIDAKCERNETKRKINKNDSRDDANMRKIYI